MRVEKNNPNQVYTDFWHWLRTDWHPYMILSLFCAYVLYLTTTREV